MKATICWYNVFFAKAHVKIAVLLYECMFCIGLCSLQPTLQLSKKLSWPPL